jgi:hypothetical protein
MGDTKAFVAAMASMTAADLREEVAAKARAFAADTLDLERTGAAFGERLAQAVGLE